MLFYSLNIYNLIVVCVILDCIMKYLIQIRLLEKINLMLYKGLLKFPVNKIILHHDVI